MYGEGKWVYVSTFSPEFGIGKTKSDLASYHICHSSTTEILVAFCAALVTSSSFDRTKRILATYRELTSDI